MLSLMVPTYSLCCLLFKPYCLTTSFICEMQVRIYYYFIFFKQAYELDEASLGIQVSVIFHSVEDYGCSYCEGVFMISVDTTYLFSPVCSPPPPPPPLTSVFMCITYSHLSVC